MNILHINCSPRGSASESHRLALRIVAHLQRAHPTAVRVERTLGTHSPLFIDGGHASALGAAHASPAEASNTGTLSVSETLISELEQADIIVIGTPMHNFGVPAALKAWVDHVVRVRRSFDVGPQGKLGRLRDRPVLVAVSSGGTFSGERARQPDFLTPYLRAVFAMIGLCDVSFFTVEGTGGGADSLAHARARAERALQAHFATI